MWSEVNVDIQYQVTAYLRTPEHEPESPMGHGPPWPLPPPPSHIQMKWYWRGGGGGVHRSERPEPDMNEKRTGLVIEFFYLWTGHKTDEPKFERKQHKMMWNRTGMVRIYSSWGGGGHRSERPDMNEKRTGLVIEFFYLWTGHKTDEPKFERIIDPKDRSRT